jgi:hypothetical protein
MKYAWVAMGGVFAAAVLAPAAGCGSKSDNGSAATAGSTVASSSSSKAASSSGAGGMSAAACDAPMASNSKGACYMVPKPDCTNMTSGAGGGGGGSSCSGIVPTPDDCDKCMQTSCCGVFSACSKVPNCIACWEGTIDDDSKCEVAAVADALNKVEACAECNCHADCVYVQCNPITAEPCDTNGGETCDWGPTLANGKGGYVCYAGGGAKVCEACDPEAVDPECDPGMTCLEDASCARYCCNDGDCGANGKCDHVSTDDPVVGACLHK